MPGGGEGNAEGSGGGTFQIPLLWPKKLKDNWLAIQSAINSLTPRDGLGTTVEQTPGGTQIHTNASPSAEAKSKEGGGGGGTSGTPIALYGAYNGAPATFHLLQSSPPTLL